MYECRVPDRLDAHIVVRDDVTAHRVLAQLGVLNAKSNTVLTIVRIS